MEVAVDPAAAASKVRWVSCPGNNSRCTQLDTNGWAQDTTADSVPYITFARGSPRHDYFLLVHKIPEGFELTTYSTAQFAPAQASRFLEREPFCVVTPVMGPTRGALIQTGPIVGAIAMDRLPAVFLSPQFAPLSPPVPAGQVPAYLVMSDTTFAFDIQPLHQVARLPVGNATYVYTKGIRLADPTVVGDDVYAYNEYGTDGWNRIVRVNADGSTIPYRAVPMRHIQGFRADSSWAVWLETYGDPNFKNFQQPNAELWAAPYTSDPTVLAATAKKIATLPGAAVHDPVYSDGYYAITSSKSEPDLPTLYVVRVSDGTVQTLNVDALVGPGAQHAYYLSSLASVSQAEVIGILSFVAWSPVFGVARLRLDPWP